MTTGRPWVWAMRNRTPVMAGAAQCSTMEKLHSCGLYSAGKGVLSLPPELLVMDGLLMRALVGITDMQCQHAQIHTCGDTLVHHCAGDVDAVRVLKGG